MRETVLNNGSVARVIRLKKQGHLDCLSLPHIAQSPFVRGGTCGEIMGKAPTGKQSEKSASEA